MDDMVVVVAVKNVLRDVITIAGKLTIVRDRERWW